MTCTSDFWVKSDVQALAAYLKLSDTICLGGTGACIRAGNDIPRAALTLADNALRPFPGLCNDIYLIGRR